LILCYLFVNEFKLKILINNLFLLKNYYILKKTRINSKRMSKATNINKLKTRILK
jgi:hypothetical protein